MLGMGDLVGVRLEGYAFIAKGDASRVGGLTNSIRGLASTDDGVGMIVGRAGHISNAPLLSMMACSTYDAVYSTRWLARPMMLLP